MQATGLTATESQPIWDILRTGYARTFNTVKTVSILGSPVILQGILSGFLDPLLNASRLSMYSSNLFFQGIGSLVLLGGSLLLMLLSIVAAYAHYSVARYVRDVYYGEEKDSLTAYWMPQNSLLGMIVLGLIIFVAAIPATAIGFIGLALLLLPGLAWFSLFFSTASLTYALYLGKPESGVVTAIKGSVDIVRHHWLNAMIIGAVSVAVILAMVLPLGFLQGLVMLIAGLIGDVTIASLASAMIHGFLSWVTLAFGTVGALFVYFGFISTTCGTESHSLPNL